MKLKKLNIFLTFLLIFTLAVTACTAAGEETVEVVEKAATVEAIEEDASSDDEDTSNNGVGEETTESEAENVEGSTSSRTYTVVETGQGFCYNDNDVNIPCPTEGEAFYGQDAQYTGAQFAFQDNNDGTVTDLNTGLMWQVTPSSQSFSYEEAVEYAENLELAGYDDWRMPSTKELFSIGDFSKGWPYFDTDVFDIAGNSVSKDEQFWTEPYVGLTHNGHVSAFGVNHGTGHIKSYPMDGMGNYVRVVRGEVYGINEFVDNGDGTVTDLATGLMWSQDDSGAGMNWQDALAYAEGSELAGYDDWRLPNVKELQSILDYSKSPNATDIDDLGPAIDTDFFNITSLPSGTTTYDPDYGYFWTSTSAYMNARSPEYYYAWYVAFGTAPGPDGIDIHGAGAVRFAGKTEGLPDAEDSATVFNYVRLVRGGDVSETPDGDPNASDNTSRDIGIDANAPTGGTSEDNQQQPGGQPRGMSEPDFAAAAETLGVSEDDLRTAFETYAQQGQKPDFASMAEVLGVTEEALMDVLGQQGGGQPGGQDGGGGGG